MDNQYDVIVIGAGYGGLAMAIHLQCNGYRTLLLEQSALPGGVSTAWRRKEFLFDGGTHWVAGSSEKINMHHALSEVIDFSRLTFLDPKAFMVIEHNGHTLTLHCDADRLEQEMLSIAPEDARTIRTFVNAVRTTSQLRIPYDRAPDLMGIIGKLAFVWRNRTFLKFFLRWKRVSVAQFAQKFSNDILRSLFLRIFPHHSFFSVYSVMTTLGWMSAKSGGFPVGGSERLLQVMVDRFNALGGELRFCTEVDEILIENHCAKGVRLRDGTEILAERVVSTADGEMTKNRFLRQKYRHKGLEKLIAQNAHMYPGLVQIAVVADRTFEHAPEKLHVDFPTPLLVNDTEKVENIMVRACGEKTGLTPPGTTTFVCQIRVSDVPYWVNLRQNDREKYKAEKQRIADEVTKLLHRRFGDFTVLYVDSGTPATYIRYTQARSASYQGWAPTPKMIGKSLSKKFQGLDRFYLAGQWVWPAGGIPGVVIVARHVAQIICHEDKKKFKTFDKE